MAKYNSHYKELSFYVEGERKQFVNGVFNTEDKETCAVLDKLADVTKVAEPKAEQPKADTKADAKPSTKAKAPAKK